MTPAPHQLQMIENALRAFREAGINGAQQMQLLLTIYRLENPNARELIDTSGIAKLTVSARLVEFHRKHWIRHAPLQGGEFQWPRYELTDKMRSTLGKIFPDPTPCNDFSSALNSITPTSSTLPDCLILLPPDLSAPPSSASPEIP